jgi:hypothetical protein
MTEKPLQRERETLLTPEQHRRMLQLWEAVASERRTPLLGAWLVLSRDTWSVTLEVAQRWMIGRARRGSPLSGWFAGRLEAKEPT